MKTITITKTKQLNGEVEVFEMIVDDCYYDEIVSRSLRIDSCGYAEFLDDNKIPETVHSYLAKKIMPNYLKLKLEVHHINKNKLDNRLENIQILTKGQHSIIHNLNKVFTEEHRKNISDANKGKYVYSEIRNKAISDAKKGVPMSEEHKNSLSKRFISDEWRKNKSIAAKEYFEKNKEIIRLKKISDGVVLPWEQAKIEASKIAKTKTDYLSNYKTIKGLVSNPNRFYPEWKGWNDYLGSFHHI